MALARVKTWSAGEVLTASDLNTEVNNILNNALTLISPLTGALDLDGFALTVDAAAVTTLQSTAAVALSYITGSKAGTPGSTGSMANFSAHTFTDSATAGAGTATSYTGFSIQRPTLAATNAGVVTTDAATLYVANSPAAGTNETITNAYALWVDNGTTRLDGDLTVGGNAAVTGNSTVTGNASVGGTLATTGVISPSQLVANTNDWAPTGLSGASIIRFSTDARRNITGLTGGATGRAIILHNVGTFPAVFKFEDSNSTAANRFAFGCSLGGGQSLEISYDATTARWRCKSKPEPLGTVKDFGTSTMPEDFLAIDQNVSRTIYASLFNEVGTAWGVGDGSTTFGLFVGAGRALIAAGTGTISEAVAAASVSIASDNFTVSSNNKKWITGQPVVLTTTGGLPTGLSLATTYFLVRSGTTAIKFATTLALAQAGTVIDITSQGTGTHTVTGTLTARTHGELLGEEDHAISSTEALAHGHSASPSPATVSSNWNGVNNDAAGGAQQSFTSLSISIGSTGGNNAMNVMQSSAVVTRGIRYC